jgi:hypothetical protein
MFECKLTLPYELFMNIKLYSGKKPQNQQAENYCGLAADLLFLIYRVFFSSFCVLGEKLYAFNIRENSIIICCKQCEALAFE